MANNLVGNPYVCDSTGTVISKVSYVRLIQWIDDNGDITHDSTLTLVVNGATFTVKIQPTANDLGFGGTAWEAGPFNPGIPIHDLQISAMGEGNLLVWL